MEDWEASERESEKKYGRRIPGSGSGLNKLDIEGRGIYDGLLLENKFTTKKSRSISLSELLKAKRQAIQMGAADWFMVVDFSRKSRFVLVEERLWQNMNETINQLMEELNRGAS